MRLSRTYQPKTLDEVVGQPGQIRRLKALVAHPSSCCVLLEGRGGVGKSAAAKALIHDLGVSEYGVKDYAGSNLKVEICRNLFGHTFKLTPLMGSPWNVLLIEELEFAVSEGVNNNLKHNLSEQNMPGRLIVIATSNDASGLDEALLQRFDVYPFSCGPSFADACVNRLNEIWELEIGGDVPMPQEVALMGWRENSYSMRRALSALGAAVEMHRASRVQEEAVC